MECQFRRIQAARLSCIPIRPIAPIQFDSTKFQRWHPFKTLRAVRPGWSGPSHTPLCFPSMPLIFLGLETLTAPLHRARRGVALLRRARSSWNRLISSARQPRDHAGGGTRIQFTGVDAHCVCFGVELDSAGERCVVKIAGQQSRYAVVHGSRRARNRSCPKRSSH